MSRAHWFAVAFAACLAGAGCKDQTTDKAGASDLSKDVQSIPMNSKNNAALGGNNAPSANSPSPSPTTQAPATPAPQAAPDGQQPGTPQPPAANAQADCQAPQRGCDPAAASDK